MNTLEAVRIALQSLWANKLRSLLTLLGVVIGVSAVIAVVTFVNGINGYVAEKIFNLGADVFLINKSPNVITNVDQWLEAQKRKPLTMEDYRAVSDACDECRLVGAVVTNPNGHVRYADQSSTDTWVRGWTPSVPAITDLELVEGRSITETDQRHASPVAIIGHDIEDQLMGPVDPIGKEIRVDGWSYTVIGVGKRQGKTLGQSRDNWVILPMSAWMRQYGTSQTSVRIIANAHDVGDSLQAAQDQARVVLRSRRHVRPGAPDNFEIDTNATFLSIWASISQNFFLVTVAIASISLIIGGIVIMNIMLVTVTERTREIGIRKALGARRRDVMAQFLIESSTMALVGGLLGILTGVVVAKTVTLLIGMPSVIKLWAVLAGVMVSAAVGIFFGVYPARRAARLDPIAALRYEL